MRQSVHCTTLCAPRVNFDATILGTDCHGLVDTVGLHQNLAVQGRCLHVRVRVERRCVRLKAQPISSKHRGVGSGAQCQRSGLSRDTRYTCHCQVRRNHRCSARGTQRNAGRIHINGGRHKRNAVVNNHLGIIRCVHA